jgi:S-phase kinase-associated protein 1
MDQKWYQDFVADENLNREMLFDLLTAANYMGIKPLLDLTCLKVTFQLTGKNAEEVSNIEGVPMERKNIPKHSPFSLYFI